MPNTTIQVKDTTVKRLKQEMKKTNSATYDEAIVKIIEGQVPKSMAGALARKKHYTREEILKDLMDEVDRF